MYSLFRFNFHADFKGFMKLQCSESCKIEYHPSCWQKVKKKLDFKDHSPLKVRVGLHLFAKRIGHFVERIFIIKYAKCTCFNHCVFTETLFHIFGRET